jgi:transcriptional regulator with XRE-family HTH domain
MPFGELIKQTRRARGWDVKEFIIQLGGDLSPAYITKIEVHGEIPSPALICKIAEVLRLDLQKLLSAAKKDKLGVFEKSLNKKYEQAERRVSNDRDLNNATTSA